MKKKNTFSGVIVPMVSPLDDKLEIDHASVEKLLDNLLAHHAIPFLLGTTGEASSMSGDLKKDLVKSVIRAAAGRSPVLAGVSSDSLQTSVNLAESFAELGVDAVVLALPSYFPMDDNQILAYIEKLADLLPLPLILYNMPATLGFSLPLDIIERISHHPNIAGIKDSERDVERLDNSLKLWSGRSDFSFWLGWAARSVYALERGADGIIPSTGNLVPEMFAELYCSTIRGEMEKALRLQELTDEISALYQGGRKLNRSLPALKALLSVRGFCMPHVLPPLLRMEKFEEQQYMEKMDVELTRLLP